MKGVERLAEVFQALSDPTRLRLLNLISRGEICVCFLVEALREPQPKVSRHLAYLKRTGIVDTRRDGKWMHYKLSDELPDRERSIVDQAIDEVADSVPRDFSALERACCSPRAPRTLKEAPKPDWAI
ncbi:MAG: metalloregulator ArsR/SmtB family transcription factor [Thermoanaerobaculia bacterium]|nr:metalloregulator ArsR/SmtB family transcription factor [Thermoanaerobaculia bacterium]